MNSDNSLKPRKKVGLALSGGFIRTVASIGVIEVLEENGIVIDLVSGCSAGAAIAGCYAAGSLKELKDYMTGAPRKEWWDVIFEPTLPRQGLLKGERNRQFFEKFVGQKTFSETEKKLVMTVTDLDNIKELIIKEGQISKAIQACTAVPGLFVPLKWQGKTVIDGGNFNMIPSKVLYESGADYVIAVYLSRAPNPLTRLLSNFKRLMINDEYIEKHPRAGTDYNIFELSWRAIRLSATQIKNFYHSSYPYDVLVTPCLTNVRRWQVGKLDYIISQGRKAALEALPQIKRDLSL